MTPSHNAIARPSIRRSRSTLGLAALAAAALASSALAIGACAPKGAGGGRGGFGGFAMPVEVAEVRTDKVRDNFRAVGTIEADEIVQVVSEVNAVVRSLPFQEGSAIGKGQVIAQLDDREIRADAERTSALVAQEQSNYERAKKLVESQAISTQELETARADFAVAEANEALARARLDKTRITAPYNGVIGRRRVSPGAFLRVGDLITEIARVDVVKVAFSAPERYVGRMRVGSPVVIATPAYPGETFRGRVSVVDPILDPRTRTIQIVAEFPNSGRRLKPGMSADVAVAISERAGALLVPDEAVFAEGNQVFVYKLNADSTVARAAITIGSRDSSQVEVLTGLASGDRIVRAGHQKLFDGAKVMPAPAGPPPGDTAARSGGGS
jgi:membrane fusion protein (multidrug efflux system)